MPDDTKKSPWLGKKDDRPHPADLPEEVYEGAIESDNTKLERDLVAARLLETPVPPENEWKRCWACGKAVPLRFRDPMFGIAVCRSCLWQSAEHEFLTSIEGVAGGLSDYLGVQAPDDDDDGEDDMPEPGELPEELAEALGITGADDDGEEGDPEVAQETSPSAVEEDTGIPSQAPPGGEESPEVDGNAKEPPPEE